MTSESVRRGYPPHIQFWVNVIPQIAVPERGEPVEAICSVLLYAKRQCDNDRYHH